MLIVDFNKQISMFAPGKCGSTALAYNLHSLTTEPDSFFRAERLKFISSEPVPNNFKQLLDSSKEYFYSLPIGDSYLMYRNIYKQENFKHYVFVREPVDRTISGFETVINWFYPNKWKEYQRNDCSLEDLWIVAQESKDFNYHVGPYLHRTKKLECEYLSIKSINTFLKDNYNLEAKHVPSVPHWTLGINVDRIEYEDFSRETDPELWDKIQLQMNKFRVDAALKYSGLMKNDVIDREVDIYNSLDI